MARGLVQAGHRVTVLSQAVRTESIQVDCGVEVHRLLPAPDWSRYPGYWRLNGYWPGFGWAVMRRFRAVHRNAPVDVIEAAECRADTLCLLAQRRRPPIVIRLHTAYYLLHQINETPHHSKDDLIFLAESLVIETADFITAPSQILLELTASWLTLDPFRTQVIPNPVDVNAFSPSPTFSAGRVLFVGRLEGLKGLETIVQAVPEILRRCPETTFCFAGKDGPDSQGRSWRGRLLDSVPLSLQDRLHFIHVRRDELIALFRSAAICVLASVWENYPYAILEAMACGVPVVATQVGGTQEIVEHGRTGLLVPPGQPDHLTSAICSLLDDEPQRRCMGREARAWVEQHVSLEKIIPRMVEIYRAAASSA
jgi:glycosyltransferase involved in cell wall biosynthesis